MPERHPPLLLCSAVAACTVSMGLGLMAWRKLCRANGELLQLSAMQASQAAEAARLRRQVDALVDSERLESQERIARLRAMSSQDPPPASRPGPQPAASGKAKPAKVKAASEATSKAQAKSATPTVTVVTQRCNSAELLVDNAERWVQTGRGLVMHVSFAEGCTEAALSRAAKALLNLPLITLGQWGDGSKPRSALGLLESGAQPQVMVVPQASMTAKHQGKTLKYHGQLDKAQSQAMYTRFIADLQALAGEARLLGMFKCGEHAGRYSRFNKLGLPLALADGSKLPKAELKATQAAHALAAAAEHSLAEARVGAWLRATGAEQAGRTPQEELEAMVVRAGTFGNRQGLRVLADCGPSTHIFRF